MLSKIAEQHYIARATRTINRVKWACPECHHVCVPDSRFCSACGSANIRERAVKWDRDMVYIEWRTVEELAELEARSNNVFLPDAGIYVMYLEPYYKIGQSDTVRARLHKLQCGAPLLELLHVIETSDMDWCEGFLHNRFRSRWVKREWFDLGPDDILWLFSIQELNPPKREADQHSLLDLL